MPCGWVLFDHVNHFLTSAELSLKSPSIAYRRQFGHVTSQIPRENGVGLKRNQNTHQNTHQNVPYHDLLLLGDHIIDVGAREIADQSHVTLSPVFGAQRGGVRLSH